MKKRLRSETMNRTIIWICVNELFQKIGRIKKESGVRVVDMSHIYQDTSDWVFTDIVHTRQTSKKIVAEAMFNHLVSLRLIQGLNN